MVRIHGLDRHLSAKGTQPTLPLSACRAFVHGVLAGLVGTSYQFVLLVSLSIYLSWFVVVSLGETRVPLDRAALLLEE